MSSPAIGPLAQPVFVLPGHENVAVEQVVETRPTYLVVEKAGRVGIVADLADRGTATLSLSSNGWCP